MLPIKRVVLFKHGVGFFQRSGRVEGDQLIELSFKSNQMNDVLKSLTTLDYGGGTFAALSYDSEEPLERRLAELTMSIPEKGAFSAFLDQLKGARVALPRGTGSLEGAVVGIEEVRRGEKGAVVTEPHLAILADEGRLVRIPLLEIDELRFLDDSIRGDLELLLGILFSGLRRDRKRLSIQAVGPGERELSISYVIEAPVWKTSYRIILSENDDQTPFLQGWALVDNTTEDDWEGVALSLVAGLPISFVHDLYAPRYRRRPVVKVEEEAAVAPPVVEGGRIASLDQEELDSLAAFTADTKKLTRVGGLARTSVAMELEAEIPRSSVEVHTRTQEVGDLFAYEITQPVSIARSRSALVPILQTEADMERVVLYNPEIREKNPMTAFRIKNTTGLTLEGGPVTVFEGQSYVGEAMLETMRANDERITPYSVELGVTVKRDTSFLREDFTKVTKSGQHIHKHFRKVRRTFYELVSRLDRELRAYLDHPFEYDMREETPEPVEITEHFWRFKLDLGPGKTTFEVREVAEDYESIEIGVLARTAIHRMVEQRLVSDEVRAALERIAAKAEEVKGIEEVISKKESEGSRIEKGQARLRENLKALGGTSEESKLRQKYVASLSGEEETIETLRREVAELKDQLDQQRRLLQEMIADLEIR